MIELELRWREPGSGFIRFTKKILPTSELALLVVDMWATHFCKTFARRSDLLADKLDLALPAARTRGIQVVFLPFDCDEWYRNHDRRRAMQEVPIHSMPRVERAQQFLPLGGNSPDKPDSFLYCTYRGCLCENRSCNPAGFRQVRQNPRISIREEDLIGGSDGSDLYSLCMERGITHLLYTGQAINMCVSEGHNFSMATMTRLGFNCIFVRDLVETFVSNPDISHEESHVMVQAYLERYAFPSIESSQWSL